MTVTVAPPTAFTPSQNAAGASTRGSGKAFTVQVTAKNGTGAAFDGYSFQLSALVDGKHAEPLYDIGAQVGGSPAVRLLPGRSVTWTGGFYADPTAGTVDVQVVRGLSNFGVWTTDLP